MDRKNKVVPRSIDKGLEDASIKVIGLDLWNTLAEVNRFSPFWSKAAMGTVMEPLLLIKDELGLQTPALKEVQDEIDARLVHFWNTQHINGGHEKFLEHLVVYLGLCGFECDVTPAAVKRLKQITNQERKDFRLFPDVASTLDALTLQGKKLVLLSNSSQFNSDAYLERTALGRYFDKDSVFWSYKLGVAKPDPRYFRFVLKALGCEAEEFLLIDDQPGNLINARSLGIKTKRIERAGKKLQQPIPAGASDIPVIAKVSELLNGRVLAI